MRNCAVGNRESPFRSMSKSEDCELRSLATWKTARLDHRWRRRREHRAQRWPRRRRRRSHTNNSVLTLISLQPATSATPPSIRTSTSHIQSFLLVYVLSFFVDVQSNSPEFHKCAYRSRIPLYIHAHQSCAQSK